MPRQSQDLGSSFAPPLPALEAMQLCGDTFGYTAGGNRARAIDAQHPQSLASRQHDEKSFVEKCSRLPSTETCAATRKTE
mmetsp:Transcript_39516/g.62753  ORF Transcript_39516/g.62753 Transcript_39516/m.62753 type:complete len:80 (+) Transcript_39516:745-984(+)